MVYTNSVFIIDGSHRTFNALMVSVACRRDFNMHKDSRQKQYVISVLSSYL